MLTGGGGRPATETTPPPISATDLWKLHADPNAVNRAADGWRTLAKALRDQAKRVDVPAQELHDGRWRGETAETFHEHRMKLTGDLREAADLADKVATALESAATNLDNAQDRLDTSWARATAAGSVTVVGDSVTFHPTDRDGVTTIRDAIAEARDIRSYLDDQLLTSNTDLSKAQSAFGVVGSAWQATANGTAIPFTMPPEPTGTGTILDFENNRFVVNTGTGDDKVEVRVDPATGKRTVVVNGVEYPVPAGMEITIRTGPGDDTISVPPGTRINLTLLGSYGNDTVTAGAGSQRVLGGGGRDTIRTGADSDRVSGNSGRDIVHTGGGDDLATGGEEDDDIDTGDGDDYASGGDGMDYLSGHRGEDSLYGGDGKDVIYAGAGDDTVTAGDDDDYIDGGRGNDTLDGGAGDDVVSGGRGDDRVLGDDGDDTLIAGDGRDTVEGGEGTDQAYTEKSDAASAESVVTVQIDPDAGRTIHIEGSDEFKERVTDDLDTLRSLPGGQQMLTELDRIHEDSKGPLNRDGNQLTIRETSDQNGYANYRSHLTGENYTIRYNPRFYGFGDGARPVTTLYHEMAHVYDYGNDTSQDGRYHNPNDADHGTRNSERQAVGLTVTDDGVWPWDDRNEFTVPDHPERYTENGLRKELGIRAKEHYTESPIR